MPVRRVALLVALTLNHKDPEGHEGNVLNRGERGGRGGESGAGIAATNAARERSGREAAPRVPLIDPCGIENLIISMALRARDDAGTRGAASLPRASARPPRLAGLRPTRMIVTPVGSTARRKPPLPRLLRHLVSLSPCLPVVFLRARRVLRGSILPSCSSSLVVHPRAAQKTGKHQGGQ
jgi:hypothetical protein